MTPDRKPLRMRFESLPPRRTAQQKGVFVRNGRAMFYTKKEVRREEETLAGLLLSRLPPGWEPFTGPVAVEIHLCYPFRKSERRGVVKAGAEIPNGCRPDLDNLCKGLIDSMVTARLIADDGGIARLAASKAWGPRAYWEVCVFPLDPGIPVAPPPKEPVGGPWQQTLF